MPREEQSTRPTKQAAFLRFEDLELEQALEASLLPGWNRLESPGQQFLDTTLVVFHKKKTWLFRGMWRYYKLLPRYFWIKNWGISPWNFVRFIDVILVTAIMRGKFQCIRFPRKRTAKCPWKKAPKRKLLVVLIPTSTVFGCKLAVSLQGSGFQGCGGR